MAYNLKSSKRPKPLPYELPYELRARKMDTYPLPNLSQVKTKDEARTMAIDYQNWASEQNLSYSEIAEYQNYFEELGKKFKLTEEFKENAII
jgi:hypothetical protein